MQPVYDQPHDVCIPDCASQTIQACFLGCSDYPGVYDFSTNQCVANCFDLEGVVTVRSEATGAPFAKAAGNLRVGDEVSLLF